ncbi:enoyl-CoA hydratase-related protein [Croceicoccus bisphenolivorans]|uniref:enoyl-CoA hydratase-related protein n=1 Tax=Croceicoccus bisphenolivorans TaxID=1783232 RepID=UPI00082E0729|nr:enoyl-CoA hydratase-related protein [Croceicoccus bisphenolivorans]
MISIPTDLTQFRVDLHDNGIVHLVFDCPDRTMNVFSNKAIHELGAFAEWLHRTDVKGVVVRSGKDNGFCAGADLTELGVAYEMIVAAPEADRFDIAFNHFFPLSHAIRRLETACKPVAAAIAGVALGGGCELALGAHYRVLGDTPRAMLGLPECQVGLLPGAGGTQRMPRLVGVEAGLEVLLQGRTFAGQAALEAGLVHEVVAPGDEVSAAEAWLLSNTAHSVQPWDGAGAVPMSHRDYASVIEAHRARELSRMLGHEPAPIAILDCVELGMMQPLDGAIRSEMSVFASLIQRAEPRNMIRAMFLGKQAHDRMVKQGSLPAAVTDAQAAIEEAVAAALESQPRLALAGFGAGADPVQNRVGQGLWLNTQPELLNALAAPAAVAAKVVRGLDDGSVLVLDHLVCRDGIVPAYFGGASQLARHAS